MEAEEDNSANVLKRQRAPLSDSEDNIFIPPGKDGQKRRRLEAAGRENHSPKQGSSGRHPEAVSKPDTPIVPSVRSRVLQLTQRRAGGTPLPQRCFSDPEANSPSDNIHNKGIGEHLLGEGEFSQRMEKFKVSMCQSDHAPSPVNPCPRTRSNFVHDIHQKLQGSPTSSEQASRIRQERDKEFSRLHFQPISENPWLKRSTSDPSLNELGRILPGSSSPSFWVQRSKMRFQWPPSQPLDGDGDADLKDGSFTESCTSTDARKLSIHKTGEDPAAGSGEGQLQLEWKWENSHQDKNGSEKMKSYEVENEPHHAAQQLESQTVLKLSFSEDQSFLKKILSETQNVLDDEQSLLDSTHPEELDIKEACELSRVTEQSESDMFSPTEDENIESSLNGDGDIEPSTDEESRLWRYPKDDGEESVTPNIPEDVCAKDEKHALSLSSVEKQKGGCVDNSDPSSVHGGEFFLSKVSTEIAGSSIIKKDEEHRREKDFGKDQYPINGDKEKTDANKRCCEAATENIGTFKTMQDQENTEECAHLDDVFPHSNEIQTRLNLESVRAGINSGVKETEASAFFDVTPALKETKTGHTDGQSTKHVAQLEAYAKPINIDIHDAAQSVTETQTSEHILGTEEMEQETVVERQDFTNDQTEETQKSKGREGLKKVTFILEPEQINETNNSVESKTETSTSDVEMSSHDDTNTAEIIDQMFEEVLEYAGRMEEDRGNDEDMEDRDSGIVACSGEKDKTDVESEKEKSEEEANEECDELLTFPSSCILSPLSKSVEAVVTPMRLAVSQESNPPSLLLTPEETTTTPTESAPLYSIDAYRTQRQTKLPTIQSVTPGVQRRAPEKSQAQQSVNTKERIAALNEEAGKLQSVINQTLQALSCCTDEEHGQGSLEEAEAEKLLLVSCEKRSALLVEVARLREERNFASAEATGEDKEYVSQQPCRGTVSITNIQLPLKVEFVCSSHSRSGRPSHYFFVLIRYGPCNIVATPLATAADAQNGDTISFPTSVTLKDIRSSFEIDVEVYSLSHASGNNCSIDRSTTKSRVTPRKLLNTITQRSSNTLASAALPTLTTRRSSNFSLVGCHKITLASLGLSKFPLDKVPFLSPLEGNIYLQLHSKSHSNVQHQGFLTMFELISGYGVWNRRYFVLDGCNMHYWNHPNDRETKGAEGSISLSSSPSHCVRPVKRDSCARPFTFELVSNVPHQQQEESEEALAKCWFSADTKQERLDWMEKLNQTLLDFHTWNRTSTIETESGQSKPSSSGNMRESIL